MELRSKKIVIETRHFDKSISAEVAGIAGDVAIHRMHDNKGLFGVTHVPTGLSFAQGLSRDNALKLAEDILNTGIDLSGLTKDIGIKKDPKYRKIAELSLTARGTPERIKEWDND